MRPNSEHSQKWIPAFTGMTVAWKKLDTAYFKKNALALQNGRYFTRLPVNYQNSDIPARIFIQHFHSSRRRH
jgi:hypothetical protein